MDAVAAAAAAMTKPDGTAAPPADSEVGTSHNIGGHTVTVIKKIADGEAVRGFRPGRWAVVSRRGAAAWFPWAFRRALDRRRGAGCATLMCPRC